MIGGRLVLASDDLTSEQREAAVMRGCGAPAAMWHPARSVPHWRHKAGHACRNAEACELSSILEGGESDRHRAFKEAVAFVYNRTDGWKAEVEVSLAGLAAIVRRPDVVATPKQADRHRGGGPVYRVPTAIEVQCSNITGSEVLARINDHRRLGIRRTIFIGVGQDLRHLGPEVERLTSDVDGNVTGYLVYIDDARCDLGPSVPLDRAIKSLATGRWVSTRFGISTREAYNDWVERGQAEVTRQEKAERARQAARRDAERYESKTCDAPHGPGAPTENEAANATTWDRLAGLRCVCPSGCTDVAWGDGGNCDHECEPCRRMAGQTYTRPPKARAFSTQGAA